MSPRHGNRRRRYTRCEEALVEDAEEEATGEEGEGLATPPKTQKPDIVPPDPRQRRPETLLRISRFQAKVIDSVFVVGRCTHLISCLYSGGYFIPFLASHRARLHLLALDGRSILPGHGI